MVTEASLQRVAQAWCTESTASRVMDPELAFAFAEILDAELAQSQARVAKLEEAITKAIVLKRFHPDRSVVPMLEAALVEES